MLCLRDITLITPRAVMLENVCGFFDPKFNEYRCSILNDIETVDVLLAIERKKYHKELLEHGVFTIDSTGIPIRVQHGTSADVACTGCIYPADQYVGY